MDRGRAELTDVAAHARGLELEDAGRLARRQEFEGLRVVERDRVEIDGDPAVFLHEIDRLAEDRQVREPQEVELEQAHRLDGVHLVLGHQRVRVGRLLEWHELGERLAADDDAGGVRAGVPGDALEMPREVGDPLDRGVRLDLLAQRGGGPDGLLERDPELVRDGLRDAVDLAVRVTEHPADVADGGPREHRAEGDDLCDVVLAVLAPDVGDDLVAPAVLEVDVDVGHRHAVGVEEALERELVEDRVDRRDAERVGDDASRGTAAAGRLDALAPGERDEVRDDQEIGRVAHLDDDAELVVEPFLECRRDRPVAALEPRLALGAQPAFDRVAVRDREMRDAQLPERQLDVGHLGDAAAVEDRVVLVREEGRHLGCGLDVELVGFELQAARRVEVVARAHAQQHVVCLGLLLADVVKVVGDDQRETDLRGEPEQLAVEPCLLRDAMVLELEVEAVLAEDLLVLARDLASQLPVLDLERLGDLAAKARAEADEALAVLRKVLTIDARLVVVAIDVGVGDEAAEVLIAPVVLGQEDQVEGLAVGLALLVRHRPAGNVGLDADDRLDALVLRRLVERDGAVEGAVVRDGHRIHALGGRRVDQLGDPAEAVEQAEFGMGVEVGEVVGSQGRHGGSMVAARP